MVANLATFNVDRDLSFDLVARICVILLRLYSRFRPNLHKKWGRPWSPPLPFGTPVTFITSLSLSARPLSNSRIITYHFETKVRQLKQRSRSTLQIVQNIACQVTSSIIEPTKVRSIREESFVVDWKQIWKTSSIKRFTFVCHSNFFLFLFDTTWTHGVLLYHKTNFSRQLGWQRLS